MKEHFKSINILWLALLLGQVIFFVVAYFVVAGTGDGSFEMLQTVVPALLLAALGGAYFITKKQATAGAALENLQEKADHYRNFIVMRSALLEGANLFAVIAMLVDNPQPYLPYFAVGLAAFLYFRPSVDRFIQDYQLKAQEAESLRTELG